MKKSVLVCWVLVLCLTIGFCGCKSDNIETEKSESRDDSSAVNIEKTSEDEISRMETSENEVSGDEDMANKTNIKDPLKNGFEMIQNPFLKSAADPFITCHDGKYYYIYSTGKAIYISSFDTLKDATMSGSVCVFNPQGETEYSRDIWAPEMHFIDGYWYIYFAGCDGHNENHRMFVLKSKTENPMGEYEFVGKITDDTDRWAIDGTVFTYKGEMYFCWSGWLGEKNVEQRIYIAKMSSPTEISSKRVCISIPTYKWERQGGRPKVNEGPAIVTDGEYLAVVYSASGSWCDDYCLGQLTLEGEDLLSAYSWKKHSEPILKTDENRFYGPGHCSFVNDEKGNLWIAFHANLESGTGWDGRSGWMYPVRINENGIVEIVFY